MKTPLQPVRPIYPFFIPVKRFFEMEASGGILLMIATVVALIWANSPWADAYFALWQTPVGFGIGDYELTKALILWINDGLMAIFFCVVGLEIKREILLGELRSLRKSALAIFAALGGMVVPALVYVIFSGAGPARDGWGIPMATDIAFALGVLALLGKRVPFSLKVFLTALAIIDDLGAVMVIALFYTDSIAMGALGVAGIAFVALVILNRMDVRHPLPFLVLGVVLWFAFLKSGIHATVAGVIFAMTVPARAMINARHFVDGSRRLLDDMESFDIKDEVALTNEHQLNAIRSIKDLSKELETPLQRLEHTLHSYTTYFIIPVFALANAGVALQFDKDAMTHGVTLGIFLGLVLGKQAGIISFAWLGVKLGWAEKPAGVNWAHIYGAGWLAGIGFTMSLFITNLAFKDPNFIDMSKMAILGASLVAGIIGFIILLRSKDPDEMPE